MEPFEGEESSSFVNHGNKDEPLDEQFYDLTPSLKGHGSNDIFEFEGDGSKEDMTGKLPQVTITDPSSFDAAAQFDAEAHSMPTPLIDVQGGDNEGEIPSGGNPMDVIKELKSNSSILASFDIDSALPENQSPRPIVQKSSEQSTPITHQKANQEQSKVVSFASSPAVAPKKTELVTETNHQRREDEPRISLDSGHSGSPRLSQEEEVELPTTEELAKSILYLRQASSVSVYKYDMKGKQLKLYKRFISPFVTALRAFNVLVLLSLAYIERPSSVTIPHFVAPTIEFFCLLVLIGELYVRYYCFGKKKFWKNKWNWLKAVALVGCYIDMFVDLGLGFSGKGTGRPTRVLRCLFVVDFSSHTHQLFRNLVKTWYKQLPALFVILIWIGLWALYGTILFHRESSYFKTYVTSYISLYSAMTTVNFPDVMVPSFKDSPILTVLFFVFFMSTTYLFYLPISIAIVTKNFREMMVEEQLSKSKLKRGAEVAAFNLLDKRKSGTVPHDVFSKFLEAINSSDPSLTATLKEACQEVVKKERLNLTFTEFRKLCDSVIIQLLDIDTMQVMKKTMLDPLKRADLKLPEVKSLNRCFDMKKFITNPYVEYFDSLMILLNGILVCWVTLPSDDDIYNPLWGLVVDFLFMVFFATLNLTRTFVLGVWAQPYNIFDLIITILNITGEVLLLGNWSKSVTYYRLTMLCNYARFLRVLSSTHRARALVAVLLKLVRMMANFIALLIVLYYTFALVSVMMFHGILVKDNPALEGTMYDAADYYDMITFNSFAAAMTTNFHLMIVNNWHVTCEAIMVSTSRFSFLFFLTFWFTITITMINVIIAFVIDSLQFLYNALQEFQTDDVLSNIMQQTTKNFESLVENLLADDLDQEDATEVTLQELEHPDEQ